MSDTAREATMATAQQADQVAPVAQDEVVGRYGVKPVGRFDDDVADRYFAIGTQKKVLHPLVQRLLPVRTP